MPRTKLPGISEQAFTNSILAYAKAYKWRSFHVRMSGVGGANVQGDRGFPDLVLVRPPQLIFAELKVGHNKLSNEQRQWLLALGDVWDRRIAIYEWRPSDWPDILKVLMP